MRKIYKYECKRILWNKFFIGLTLILLFYGWQVLGSVTVLGVSHTAPFSPWSFGDYLSRLLPLLWVGSLLFLTFFTSGKARRVMVLTNATPVSPRRYALTRCAAALTGTGLLVLFILVEAGIFYGVYFRWYKWGSLLSPAFMTLLPPLLFALGSGWLLGQNKGWLLYIWMLLPFACMALPLPKALSLWNGSFFTEYPLALGGLDPAFSMPVSNIAVQCILLLIGAFLLFNCSRKRKIF